MGWYVPFDKLGQRQLEVINGITAERQQVHWVQGFAGTGKTLLLTHVLERVAALEPRSRICFITFTHALKDLVAGGLHGAVAHRVAVTTHTQFLKDRTNYDYVFLDEVQDISELDLRRIKGLATNLYLAGDGDQRIYDKGASEPQIIQAVAPTTWALLEIFRLTRRLQQVAQSILPRTRLIEGLRPRNMREVTIQLMQHESSRRESEWTWKEALRRARPGDPSAILFPTHKAIAGFASDVANSLGLQAPPTPTGARKDYGPFNEFWESARVSLMYFGNSYGSLGRGDTQPMVYLMTFHSSKGLDFKNVFIPGMTNGATIVHQDALYADPELDRRLLFVAVTRSRENLCISYSGPMRHALLSDLPNEVVATMAPANPIAQGDEEFF